MNIKQKTILLYELILKGYFAQTRNKIYDLSVDINCPDSYGRTPLILCCLIEDLSWSSSLSRQLLEMGVDLKRSDWNRMNILHYCCLIENSDLLKLILDSLDSNINAIDSHGNTPLLYAIASGNQTCIDILLKYYEKYRIDIDKSNYKGINAFMEACICENAELIEELLKFNPDLMFKDCNNKTAAMYREEFNKKSYLMQKVASNRRQSRIVRFDDLELIRQIQEESKSLMKANAETKENANNLTNNKNDPITAFVKDFQLKVKKIKRNKIDIYYANKLERPKTSLSIWNIKEKELTRPKTTSLVSRKSSFNGNWYSMLGPLYVSLEQKHSSAYREFYQFKNDSNTNSRKNSRKNSVGINRIRRSSRTSSRRGSIAKIKEEGDDSVFYAATRKN